MHNISAPNTFILILSLVPLYLMSPLTIDKEQVTIRYIDYWVSSITVTPPRLRILCREIYKPVLICIFFQI